jgi:uncharacterized protein YjcR
LKYTDEQKDQAQSLYLAGNKVPEIETQLGIERRTLYLWIKKENWDKALNKEDTLYTIKKRIRLLAERENKTTLEIKELDSLISNLIRLEKLYASLKAKDESAPAGSTPGGERRRSGRKPAKNDFSQIDEQDLMEKFRDGLFGYQLDCWNHLDERIRNILKSRQIGMTFYFAREAFTDALLTGDNQIFLSASRAQSDVFREYIKFFALDWYGVELTGKDKIELITPKGKATLYFLSTNSATAQSYHGHVYIDEYFWIPKFSTLKKVATAMASQKKWRKTFFSTPSAKSHEAYPMWSGDEFNERKKRANKPVIIFPGRKELRKQGVRGADLQWRRIITIEDAEREGCNLFNIEQLKVEYSEDEYRQLFMCYFIDDSASVFKFSELEKCLTDLSEWKDFKPEAERPYKGKVWIGYDPSRSRDGACIVVIAAPKGVRGKFRVLEKIDMKNAAWQFQAATIKDLVNKYDVEYIGIDRTGPGDGVCEMVERFYPAVEGIFYSQEKKTKLVLKAQQVIADQRIEWDVNWSDIAAGFLQIHRAVTGGGGITYVADRNDKTGHADAAWAIMHALINEDFILLENDDEECEWAFSA